MSDTPRERPKLRNLLGTVMLIGYLAAYSLLVMAAVSTWMVDRPIWLQTIFYAVAGIAWLPPAGWLLRWMARG